MTEAWLFCKFVGTSVGVGKILLCELGVQDKLQPRGGLPEHLLWALYLMKVHIKQGPGSWVVGASCGAVQPKTNRKWVWAFIKAIAKLIDLVVSIYIIVFIGTCLFIFFLLVARGSLLLSHPLLLAPLLSHVTPPLLIIAVTLISPNLRST